MCTQDGGTLPGSPLRLSSLPRSRSLGCSGQVPSHPQGVQGHFSGGGWGADGPAGAQLGHAAQIPIQRRPCPGNTTGGQPAPSSRPACGRFGEVSTGELELLGGEGEPGRLEVNSGLRQPCVSHFPRHF